MPNWNRTKPPFELTAEQAGTLQIIAQAGDTVEVGAVVCKIEANGQSNTSEEKAPEVEEEPDEPEKEKAPVADADDEEESGSDEVLEMKIPTVGESITEVTLSEWMKADGDQVEMDEVIAEIESDKATFELTAEAAGTLRIVAEAGTTLEVGALACKIETGGSSAGEQPAKEKDASEKKSPEKTESSANGQGKETYATGHASPAAAKILAEKNIDAEEVKGSGRDGRITKEDAEKAQKSETTLEARTASPKEQKAPTKESAATPAPAGEREQRREKMSSNAPHHRQATGGG